MLSTLLLLIVVLNSGGYPLPTKRQRDDSGGSGGQRCGLVGGSFEHHAAWRLRCQPEHDVGGGEGTRIHHNQGGVRTVLGVSDANSCAANSCVLRI